MQVRDNAGVFPALAQHIGGLLTGQIRVGHRAAPSGLALAGFDTHEDRLDVTDLGQAGHVDRAAQG
jgi:hypothetical protein